MRPMQVMLGVDRLDMIKGIPQKLLAFEKFLEEHPQWRDKVLLVQIAVPSRTDVPEYQVTLRPILYARLHCLRWPQVTEFCLALVLSILLPAGKSWWLWSRLFLVGALQTEGAGLYVMRSSRRYAELTSCVVLQRLRSMVHEVVGRINGHYGTLTHVPIHHLDRQLAFHELCALYAVTDIALVTSLRDGMNLVSYEYVACQSDNAGESTYHPYTLSVLRSFQAYTSGVLRLSFSDLHPQALLSLICCSKPVRAV